MAKKMSKMEQMKLTKAKRAEESGLPSLHIASEESIVSIGGQDTGKKAERRMIMTGQIAYNENNDYSQLDSLEDIKSLAENIKQNGLEHNLVVVERSSRNEPDKRYVLLSGERRLRAIRYVQENEDPTFFPEVACYVIPASEFIRPAEVKMSDEEYRYRVEMIKLDTANLQSRGGTGDSTQTTKAMNRYKENVMAAYRKTEREANAQLLSIVGDRNKRFFERSQQLYKNLLPELYALYVDKETDLPQQDFLRFTSFTDEEQGKLYETAKQLYFKREEMGEDYEIFRTEFRNIIGKYDGSSRDQNELLLKDCNELLEEINNAAIRNEKLNRYKSAVETIEETGTEYSAFFIGANSPFTKEELIALIDPTFHDVYAALEKTVKKLTENRQRLESAYFSYQERIHEKVTEAITVSPNTEQRENLFSELNAIEREIDKQVQENQWEKQDASRIALGVSAKEQRIRNRSEKMKKTLINLTDSLTAKDTDRFAKQVCASREEAADMLSKLEELSKAIDGFREKILEAQNNG